MPALFVALLTGLRLFGWRWRAVVSLGAWIVFWTVRVAIIGAEPEADVYLEPVVLVFVGATGGCLAQFAVDRGEEERKRRSAAFLAG